MAPSNFRLSPHQRGLNPNRPLAARRAALTALAAVACWAALAVGAEGQTSAATDRAALVAFYDACGASLWHNHDHWKSLQPLSAWEFVTTDAAGRVTRLDLSANGLRCSSLPVELGSLANLQVLDLADNYYIRGQIPAELGSLANLQVLDLSETLVTGPIPAALGNLANLQRLDLSDTWVTGPIPAALGNLANLQRLDLGVSGVTGPIPAALGNLANLQSLDLSYAWGLSGGLPPSLRRAPLRELDILVTQACAPNEWWGWLKTIEFTGRLCDDWIATIDVAVVYTPAARDATGGAAEIAALIDLWVAETNQAYAASGVRHRVELVGRSEVEYVESVDDKLNVLRLEDPSDGHMDEAHALRDRVGADLVHLIADGSRIPTSLGIALRPGAFGVTGHHAGGLVFAHELGHNLGLRHDRGATGFGYYIGLHPAFGWVNPQGLVPGAASHRRWRTIMAYAARCVDAGVEFECPRIPRFSSARQSYNGDPLGKPFGSTHSGEPLGAPFSGPHLDGRRPDAVDAAAVLNATGPAVALWRDRVNRAPVAVGRWTESLTFRVDDGPAYVEMSGAFRDPDGDPLTYAAFSSSSRVASVEVSGSTVTVTPAAAGAATVTVTATDVGGSNSSATQTFFVTVENSPPAAVGALAAVTIDLDESPVSLEMSGAFRDPDGDLLTLGAVSSAPAVASVSVSGSTVTVTPAGVGTATVTVTATDAGGSNSSATQTFTVTVEPPNRPPEAVGALEAVTVSLDEAPVSLDVAGAFRDPEDDPLTYEAVSSAPAVASASVSGSTVTVTPAGAGTAVVRVTATDADGLSATQRFVVRVLRPFTDDPIQPGSTPIRAVHFTELRTRIDGLRRAAGLARFWWTDPVLLAGVTRVRLVHLLELREALDAAYQVSDRTPPPWTDAAPAAGATIPIRAAHLTELRAAVVALERGRRVP